MVASLARKAGVSKHVYARDVVVEWLSDLRDEAVCRRRISDVLAGHVRLVPLVEAAGSRSVNQTGTKPRRSAASRSRPRTRRPAGR